MANNINVPVVVDAVSVQVPAPVETRTEDAAITAARIQQNASTFYELYARYTTVRELARVLNGLQQNSPFPNDVKIEQLELTFNVGGVSRSVTMAEPRAVGELAPIIASTLSTFIELMHQEIFNLNASSAAMQQAIENTILRRDASQQPPAP
jgi:ethanolamine utilization protein EutA (predicted chaperonin)